MPIQYWPEPSMGAEPVEVYSWADIYDAFSDLLPDERAWKDEHRELAGMLAKCEALKLGRDDPALIREFKGAFIVWFAKKRAQEPSLFGTAFRKTPFAKNLSEAAIKHFGVDSADALPSAVRRAAEEWRDVKLEKCFTSMDRPAPSDESACESYERTKAVIELLAVSGQATDHAVFEWYESQFGGELEERLAELKAERARLVPSLFTSRSSSGSTSPVPTQVLHRSTPSPTGW